MSIPVINIDGTDYELSTKLRVAYKIQSQNEHKPYAEIFSQIDKMPLEKQIEILYTAFEVANPEKVLIINRQKFLDFYLDNLDLNTMMQHLQAVVEGILGKSVQSEVVSETDSTEVEKN